MTVHGAALLLFPGPSPAESGSPAAASSPTDPGDRSTAFQPVEGGTEHRSGETLLVAAYAGLWALLMAWVFFQWTKQTALARRLDALEGSISAAARREASPAKPKATTATTTPERAADRA